MAMAMAIAATFLAIGVPFCLNNFPSLEAMPLVQRQLPGFSISLPSGEEKASELGYREGRLELIGVADGGGKITVRWEPGKPVELDGLDQLARVIAGLSKVAPGTTTQWPGPNGTSVLTSVLQMPNQKIWLSMMRCGQRRISVLSIGPEAMGGLHRRILPTIACRPVPGNEAQLNMLSWTIELPAGWFVFEEPPGQITLANGDHTIVVRGDVVPTNRAGLAKLLRNLFSAEDVHLTFSWEGDRLAMRGALDDGHAFAGWAWVPECPMGRVLVMVLSSDTATASEVLELVTAKGRCLKQGEVAPPWPERQPDPDPDPDPGSTTQAASE
jgi:hypothetical protein